MSAKETTAGVGVGSRSSLLQTPETSKIEIIPPNEIDIYRDTPVRLLGYANEVGESFRALIHKNFVRLSYGIAFTYVLADTHDKSKKVQDPKQKVIEGLDVLLWQTMASVAIPGFTINRICYFTGKLLKKTTKWPSPVRKWTTTAVGLSCIPFIVHPIDSLVDRIMDKTYRSYFGSGAGTTTPSTTNGKPLSPT